MGLSEERKRWALDKFDALVATAGSQNKACQIIGISPAIISPLRRGVYKGDADEQFGKLISYFETKEEAAASPAHGIVSGYVQTSISTRVYEVIRNCQLKGGLAVACGAAGIGKTMAAKQFAAEHPNEAVYMVINPCFTTLKAVLKVLCNKLNVAAATNDEMWLGLANKLRDGQVIIVDEAQHLTIKVMEALRALSDYFDERGQTLGIVLIGNTETANTRGGRKRAEFAQITNRTRQRKEYTTSQIRRDDIQILFPALKDDAQSVELLLGIARSPQALRGARNLFVNAADNEDTSYAGLVGMAKHMGMVV